MSEFQSPASIMPTKPEENETAEEEVGSKIVCSGARRKRGSYIINSEDRYCRNCGTRETTLWRRSKLGSQLLCNACGTYERLHDSPRPFGICQRSTHRTRRRVRRTNGTVKAAKSNISPQGPSSAPPSSRQTFYGWKSHSPPHDGTMSVALSARASPPGTMNARQGEQPREYHTPIAPTMTSFSADNMHPPQLVAFSHEGPATIIAGPHRAVGRPVHMFQPRGYDVAVYNYGGNQYESRMSPSNFPLPIKAGGPAMNGVMNTEYGQCSCADCYNAHCGPQNGQWYDAPFNYERANGSGHVPGSDSIVCDMQYTKYGYSAPSPGPQTYWYGPSHGSCGAMHIGGPIHYGSPPEFTHPRPYFGVPERGDAVAAGPYSKNVMDHYYRSAQYLHTPIPS